ncbi:MAG: zinc ribbon domain-containing protein [Candidatus Hodarchaeales archaeon]
MFLFGGIFTVSAIDNQNFSSQQTIFSRNKLQSDSNNSIKVLSIKGSDEDQEKLAEYSKADFWSKFGSKNVIFDTESTRDTYITLDLLLSSNADVLFLSNLIAENFVLDSQERQAIREYVQLGHGIIGTHGSLEPIGHSDLAPLFGINPDMIESTEGFMPIIDSQNPFNLMNIEHQILDGVSDIYSTGHTPTMSAFIEGESHPWTADPRIMLENGSILATSVNGNAAIITSEGLFNSIYLTYFHIRNSLNQDDDQLLYNSILWAASKSRGNQVISFRALIDGEDDLLLRGNEIWYNHKEFYLPGLHDSNNFSTQINNYNWYPKFPYVNNGELDLVQESEPLKDYSYIPKYKIDYSLELVEIPEDGSVVITQQPSVENNYTLLLSIHDGPVGGSWWYEFNILYETDSEFSTTEISEPQSNQNEDPNTITHTPENNQDNYDQLLIFYSLIVTFILIFTVVKKYYNSEDGINEELTNNTPQVQSLPQFLFCYNCGNKMQISDKFCENCGTFQGD